MTSHITRGGGAHGLHAQHSAVVDVHQFVDGAQALGLVENNCANVGKGDLGGRLTGTKACKFVVCGLV